MKQQEITKEQLEAIKAECTPNVTMATRQVLGGFIVTGQVQWAKDGVVQAVQQDEAVSSSVELLTAYVNNYHLLHTFDLVPARQRNTGL